MNPDPTVNPDPVSSVTLTEVVDDERLLELRGRGLADTSCTIQANTMIWRIQRRKEIGSSQIIEINLSKFVVLDNYIC